MKIGVILPVEERFDPVEGGAIARWVASVYPHLPYETTIFAAPPLKGEGYPLALWKSRRTKQLDTLATAAANGLSRLFKRNPVAIRAKLMSNGKLWVAQLTKHLHDFDILHIHNRPTYVQWIRQSGYKGHIILHMHNSLDIRRPDHAPDAVACADQVLFCSEFLKSEAASTYDELPLSGVVLNGIEPYQEPLGLFERERGLLVTAGRLVPEKGALEAIYITEELCRRGFQVKLVVCGSFHFGTNFKSPYVRKLEMASQSVNAHYGRQVIQLPGQLAHHELMTTLRRAQIFLYPCQWNEPFGMVVAEAMGNGTPPVVSRRGGIPEIIGENLLQQLAAPSDDPSAFTSLIETMLEDDQRWGSMSQRVYSEVNNRLAWKEVALELQKKIGGNC